MFVNKQNKHMKSKPEPEQITETGKGIKGRAAALVVASGLAIGGAAALTDREIKHTPESTTIPVTTHTSEQSIPVNVTPVRVLMERPIRTVDALNDSGKGR